ncbi:hypothetical protein QYM36_018829 [Artemia franciscana]|uniref:Uncharacterized protein n=1 Tax=Artemia franciscana TaxID=6661 RepID=A0AA88H1V5_ARTSF|nr:hypothetical protein QYM36_018829 [Artemia franciscana]
MNEGKLRDKQTRGRGGSGFSMGSERLDFNSDRERPYFNCGKGEWMNRSSVNDTDTRVRGGLRFSRGSKKQCFNNGRERPYLNRGKGEHMNGGRVSDKETRGRDSSGFSRGIDMLDLNICGARPYFNSRNVSYKITRGRGRSGFSRGRTRIDFKNCQGFRYSKRGEEEPINRAIVHSQEIASNSTVIKEALSAIIKLLQKRLEIALKEHDHCRDEIKKLVYDGCIYETLNNLYYECIKYIMHTGNSLNNSESFGFKNYSLIPLFEKILQITCSDNIQQRISMGKAIRERMNRKSGFRRIPDCKNSRERPYLIRGQADQINGDRLRDKQTKGRGGLTISGGRLSNKETRGRGSSGLSRGSDMLDLNVCRGRLYFNIKGRGRSGFSKGSTRVDLKNGRGGQYSNRGKEQPMNRSTANNQETIEAALMTIEPLIAEIKHLQKRVEITLKERNHCREEIKKIIYKGDIYELLHLLCHECIKYMMHTENSLNDSEIFGYIIDIKEISLIPVFINILKGHTLHRPY